MMEITKRAWSTRSEPMECFDRPEIVKSRGTLTLFRLYGTPVVSSSACRNCLQKRPLNLPTVLPLSGHVLESISTSLKNDLREGRRYCG